MSTHPPSELRHPLGLPRGSVRAILALQIAALFWILLLLPPDKRPVLPLYLYFLLGLELVFFTALSHSSGHVTPEAAPWGLPRGFFRNLILLGTALVVGYEVYRDPQALTDYLQPRADQLQDWPPLLGALLGGFTLGHLLRSGPWQQSLIFQDLQAWLSLLCMLGLGVEVLLKVFISPNLKEIEGLPRPIVWESILTGVVALYFGVRS